MRALLTMPERDAERWGFWFAAWLVVIGWVMGCFALFVEDLPEVREDETGFEGVVTVLWVVGWSIAGAGGFMAVFGRCGGSRRAWLKLLWLEAFPGALIPVVLGIASAVFAVEAAVGEGWWGLAGVVSAAVVCMAVLMRNQGRVAVWLIRNARAGGS